MRAVRVSLQQGRPDLASQWHPDNILSPSEVSLNSHMTVWWLCVNGHSWKTRVDNRNIQNSSCPDCAGRNLETNGQSLQEKYPEIADEWNFDLNKPITPSTVSFSSMKIVWWKCVLGHTWNARINNRTSQNRNGCPYCSNKKPLPGYNDLASLFPDLLLEWNTIRNIGIDPTHTIFSSHKRVSWVCNLGHQWITQVCKRTLRGQGCPYCANRKVLFGFNDLKSQYPLIAKEWDTDNNSKSPQEVLYGSTLKAYWVCKEGHRWKGSIEKRTRNGNSCVECSKRGTSRTETAFRQAFISRSILDDVVLTAKYKHPLRWRNQTYAEIDIFGILPHTDRPVAIEYDGAFYHENTPRNRNVHQRDLDKTFSLLEAGFLVVRIRENKLPFLVIKDENLLQVRYDYNKSHANVHHTVNIIEKWLVSKK